tara:strand:- start:186 stop:662 length:477 start_codon:yes stop_codon:yes gene_type:complete
VKVVKKSQSFYPKGSSVEKKRTINRFKLIHGSFSAKKLSRQFPVLSGLHNALDGALIGVIISVALMSTLALHWRHLWIVAFTRLESTRDLSHNLIDSTAMLERNLLDRSSLPINLVPTKAENLFYLDNPFSSYKPKKDNKSLLSFLKKIQSFPVYSGY